MVPALTLKPGGFETPSPSEPPRTLQVDTQWGALNLICGDDRDSKARAHLVNHG